MPVAPSFYLGKQAVQEHVDQALVEIIQSDESLFAAFHGQALSGEGYGATAKTKGGFSLHDYLLVTDERVIFWARGLFKRSTDGFHYDDIASVEESTGLLTGEIVLNVRGAKERMRSMVKTDVPVAARMIRDLVGHAKGRRSQTVIPPPAAQPQAIYLLGDNGTEDGPYDIAQVRQKLAAGEVKAGTLVWHEGLSEWLPLSQVIRAPSMPPPRPAPLPTPKSAIPVSLVMGAPTAAPEAPSPEPPPAYPAAHSPVEPPASASSVTAKPPSSELPLSRPPWYKRKGWQITFFIIFPYFQVPLMWYWQLFSRRTRIWMTVGGCFWSLCILGGQGDRPHSESERYQTSTVAPASTPQATTENPVSWYEINAIYNLNSRNTDLQKKEEWKRFKGKKVTWTGQVASVSDGFMGVTLQIKMNPDTFTSDLLISLKRSERSKAAQLHQGDSITFSGRLDDWGTLMPITLDQGEIRN